MTEYTVGQKVRITQDTSMHRRSVGDIVTLKERGTVNRVWRIAEDHEDTGYRPFVAEADFEPVEITIQRFRDFQVGDTVTGFSTQGYPTVERIGPTVEPPEPGTRGTSIVEGVRIHGIIDSDGDFAYLAVDEEYGDIDTRYVTPYDFQPYEEDN